MKMYIDSYVERIVPANDQRAFLTDVMEDLQQIDHSRIAGLGITAKELEDWLKRQHSQN